MSINSTPNTVGGGPPSDKKGGATPALQGYVAVFADEDGRVITEATDFSKGGYGGFTLAQAQRLRVRRALAHAVVNAYASHQLARAIDGMEAESMVQRLVRKFGCTVTLIPVGHDDEKTERERA